MKIISLNKRDGIAKVRVNSSDDLWHLSKIISSGDLVSGKTTRKIKLAGEQERQRAVKKTITLTVQVTKREFSPEVLKCLGKVESGPENISKGSTHSLEFVPGSIVKIQKPKWHQYEIERLKEAEKQSAISKALVCVLDDEQANLAILTGVGIKYIGKIELRLSKKRIKEKIKERERFKKLIKEIQELDKKTNPKVIILASPIVWKESLFDALKDTDSQLAKKCRLENTSTGSRRGIEELLKSGGLDKLIKRSRLEKELQLVEELLAEISKNKLASYGWRQTKAAADAGAIKTLLLTDKFIEKKREQNDYDKVEALINLVEQIKGQVHIISTEHEGGKKLDGLGGIAGLLRFRVV